MNGSVSIYVRISTRRDEASGNNSGAEKSIKSAKAVMKNRVKYATGHLIHPW